MAEDKLGLDEYREKLNEELGDCGGCTEAWSATNELREQVKTDADEGSKPIKRRSLMQSVGISAGALTLGPSLASAKEGDVDGPEKASHDQIEKALNTEEVQTLFSELNIDGKKRLPLQRGKAKYINIDIPLESDEDITAELTTLPTPAGEAYYSEASNGSSEASFLFGATFENQHDISLPPGQKKKLPDRYQDLPDSGAKLTYADGEFTMARFPTESEKKEIIDLIGVSGDEIRTSVNSQDGAFRVTTTKGVLYEVDTGFENPAYSEVPTEKFEDANAEQLLTAQGCLTDCATCVAALGGGCFFTCGLACLSVVTLAGMVPCAACAITFCGTAPLICGKCSKCS